MDRWTDIHVTHGCHRSGKSQGVRFLGHRGVLWTSNPSGKMMKNASKLNKFIRGHASRTPTFQILAKSVGDLVSDQGNSKLLVRKTKFLVKVGAFYFKVGSGFDNDSLILVNENGFTKNKLATFYLISFYIFLHG